MSYLSTTKLARALASVIHKIIGTKTQRYSATALRTSVDKPRVSNAHPDAGVQRVTRSPASVHLNQPIKHRILRPIWFTDDLWCAKCARCGAWSPATAAESTSGQHQLTQLPEKSLLDQRSVARFWVLVFALTWLDAESSQSHRWQAVRRGPDSQADLGSSFENTRREWLRRSRHSSIRPNC